jgi:hypothetical protein
MGEILKQGQSEDRPETDTGVEEDLIPRLRFRFSHVDFVSPLGAFRATESKPSRLDLAPNSSEVWQDWRSDLGRRIAYTAVRADELLTGSAR